MVTRAALLLPLLAFAAACGPDAGAGESCAAPLQRFSLDGDEVGRSCNPLNVRFSRCETSDTTRGWLVAGEGLGGGYLELAFGAARLPAQFQIGHTRPLRADDPNTSYAVFWHSGLRATGGTGTISVEQNRLLVSMEGTLARRDGQERPFHARFEILEPNLFCTSQCLSAVHEPSVCADFAPGLGG